MADVLGLVAGPRHIRVAGSERGSNTVDGAHPLGGVIDRFQNSGSHSRHNAHAHDDVGGVGDLNANLGERRTERPHGERNNVHPAAAHGALEESIESVAHFCGRGPVVGGAGIALLGRADEGA